MFKREIVWLTLPALVLLPVVAHADGGGPLLLIVNVFLFSVGQVWILLAEFLYLVRRLPAIKKARVFGWVVAFNALSTLGGALLLPFLWAALFGALAWLGPWRDSTMSGVLAALGTWVVGDQSPFPWLAMMSSGVLFLATYLLTVWIEYRLLLQWRKREELPPVAELRRMSFIMNSISYAGLVALFLAGTVWK